MSIVRPMSKVKCNLIPLSRPRPSLIGILPCAGGTVMSLFEPTRPLSICGMSSAQEGSDLQGQWRPARQGQADPSLSEPAHLLHVSHLTCFGWFEMAGA